MSATGGGRIGWIDVARAAGAVAIVLLHVLVSTRIACDLSVARQVAYAVVGITLTRWAVPAFFMISGLLLLDPHRAMDWGRALGYARRMVVVLATFGVAFALMEEAFDALTAHEGLSPMLLVDAVVDVLCGRTWDHLWYVYATLVAYLALPPLHALRLRIGERGFACLAGALFVAVLVVPTLMRAEVPNALIAVACLCVGACLPKISLGPLSVCCGLGSLLIMLWVSVSGVLAGIGDEGFIFLQGSCFACAWATLVLLSMRELLPADAGRGGVVAALARESFGIYLVHPFFVHLLLIAVDPQEAPAGLFEALSFVAVLAVSYGTCRLLRHVPIVGDVI